MQSLRKYIFLIYLALLLLVVIYVSVVLKTNNISVVPKAEKSSVAEVHPANVLLLVVSPTGEKAYTAGMKNTDTVMDLLEHLRQYDQFTYEKTMYTYGPEFDHVNGFTPPQGTKWQIFWQDKNITNESGSLKLEDGATYTLSLVS